jgi:hypothetical protein
MQPPSRTPPFLQEFNPSPPDSNFISPLFGDLPDRQISSGFMTWLLKKLPYGGTCQECEVEIVKWESGWHNPDIQKVRCILCGEPVESEEPLATESELDLKISDPVGGSSSLREARIRNDSTWLKGATGEYLMGVSLEHRLNKSAKVLTDRRLPGTDANIDHIVIASSGVWIIDSKKWKGKIEYKANSMMSINNRLYVDGEDRTSKVESIYGSVIPVAQLIGDRSIPIHPALVFIEADWSTASLPRCIAGRPYVHDDVYIAPPKLLIKLINRTGPLNAESISRIAAKLDAALKPR